MNLISKGTWRVALLPKGRRLLGCRLVLKRKVDKMGTFHPTKPAALFKDIPSKKEWTMEDYFNQLQP